MQVKSTSIAHSTRGYLVCVVAITLLSTTAIFIRYLTETTHIPALVLAFWRDLFVALALIGFFFLFNRTRLRVEHRHLGFLILYGFILAVFNSIWTVSVAINGAAVATVLAYSSAAFTAVLGWRLFAERLGPGKFLALVLCLVGCVFVAGAFTRSAWQLNLVGILGGVFSGLAYSLYILMGRASSQRGLNPWTALLYSFCVATLFILIFDLIPGWLPAGLASTKLFWLGTSSMGWIVLLVLAIGPTVCGFGLYTVSLVHLPASVANLISTLEPAMTATWAYLFLGERFTGPQFFGSALIIAGVIVIRLSESTGAA